MTKLNQFVAIEKGEKAAANRDTAHLFHAAKNGVLFAGLSKTYEPVEDGGEELPEESTRVQFTVKEILENFVAASSRLLDVQMTKENGNTKAFADVKIGDHVIIEAAPVTFLLQLEKYLSQEVRGLIQSLPTLDPSQDWSVAEVSRQGVMQTGVIKRHRTKKVQKPIVLYQATPEHPAQTQMINEDVLAGYWSERRFSGAIPASRKQELLDRVEELIKATKFAREEANSINVVDKKVADGLFGYLFN